MVTYSQRIVVRPGLSVGSGDYTSISTDVLERTISSQGASIVHLESPVAAGRARVHNLCMFISDPADHSVHLLDTAS